MTEMPSSRSAEPSRIPSPGRALAVVGITAVAAFWLYIDRVCFSILADPIQTDLGLAAADKELVLGMFFLTYALFQVPVGLLADRYGARRVLTAAIAAWSLVTLLTGFVESLVGLIVVRLLLGMTEAGAYPAAAGLIKNWSSPAQRGRFSSMVALGGRIGGAVAPWLTAGLAATLGGIHFGKWDNPSQVQWRSVFVIYGICGLLVAAVFWVIVRDRIAESFPDQPRGQRPAAPSHRHIFLLVASRNIWLFSLMQWSVNLGWAFLITLLPTYLNEAHQVPLAQRGQMQSMALFVGCCGMFLGGWLTDWCHRLLGARWGRAVPLVAAHLGCAVTMTAVPWLPTPWAIVAALGIMAFLVDMHNPVIWSFAQDIGGRKVGAALGFGNMWGNLGAAASPIMLGMIQRQAGWDAIFLFSGLIFLLAGVCGLLLDARRPIEPSPETDR